MDKKINVGAGFELEIPQAYGELRVDAEKTIGSILENYPKASKMWRLLKEDPEVNACWDIANYIAVSKLKYNDHGEVHTKIVAANALKMLKILLERGVKFDFLEKGSGDVDDEHLVVLTGALLHDIGNQVHRKNHPLHSVYLAIPILNRLLPSIYGNPEIMYEIRGHILHTIYTHGAEIKDLTMEASLVGIADGTDMTKGRGRLAFDTGNVNIHSVSALSISGVEILRGEERPIEIYVKMNNSAGIFQVQEVLLPKISGSPLEQYIEIVAVSIPPGEESDQRIVHRLSIEEGRLVPK